MPQAALVPSLSVLILLPPSEGKTRPSGAPYSPTELSWPALRPTRDKIVTELGDVLNSEDALAALKLTGAAAREFSLNTNLAHAPAGPAHEVYTGVLFQALNYEKLNDHGRRHAPDRIAVVSALWGLVGLEDRIPAYRLSAGMKLPNLGGLTPLWRTQLTSVLDPSAHSDVIVDCRSGPYVAMWKPRGELRENWLPVRVFSEKHGERIVVSHHAKHTRGLLARHLLENASVEVRSIEEIVAVAASMPGVQVELNETPNQRPSESIRSLDLIITA